MATSPSLFVMKSQGELVLPSEPTPTPTLSLSVFDKVMGMGWYTDYLLVFKHGRDSAKVIKAALAKALVFYYPLAGRVVRPDIGTDPHVECTNDGVWFIKATTDCNLEDTMGLLVGNCTLAAFPRDQLLPSHPNPAGITFMLQVTEFSCGGFTIGIKYDHIMADAMGIAQIMGAIGDIARGLKVPTILPIWLREFVPTISDSIQVPRITLPMSEPREYLMVDVSHGHINQLKEQFLEQTGEKCSTFDVVVAELWQCRIRAVGMSRTTDPVLGFAANIRNLLSEFLPSEGGYYGNCVFQVWVFAPAQASVVELVSLIKDAKKRLPERFSSWAKGELTPDCPAGYDLFVTDMRDLGFSKIDYGWGEPAYFASVPSKQMLEAEIMPFCRITRPPAPDAGCRLLAKFVKEHCEAFVDQIMKLAPSVKIVGIN